jgi:hypothetical protein
VIELYAITDDPPGALPDLATLRAVAAGGLAAIWAPAPEADAAHEIGPEDLWRFEAVVEALMADRDLLPMRFGTRVADPEAARAVLHERHDELTASLDRVRGATELAVRVVAAPGARADAAAALADVHPPLAAIARASTVRRGTGPDLLRAAYLVDRGAVDSVTRLVAGLERAFPGLRLLCTGPWPPYSFAS